MSRYGTKCSWGEPPCSHMFRAPSLHLLHTQVLDHLRERHAETPEEVAGFYVEWEDAAGVWHRLPAERIGSELIAVGAEVRSTTENREGKA